MAFLTIESDSNAARTVDYLDLIGTGKIPGHESFCGFGQRSGCSAAASGNDAWEGVTDICPAPDQTVGEQLTIASSSILDAAAGTGIRTLDIHGLDISGNPQSEIITLGGQTPVNTVRTNWRFNQTIHAETVGADGFAAGTISIYRTGDAARVYNVIKPGGNMSLNSQRMVPAGKVFYMKDFFITGASGKSMSVRLRATSTFEDTLTTGNFFLAKDIGFVLNSIFPKQFSLPLKFPALSIIKGTAYSLQAGGDVSFSYNGWLE